MTETTIINLSQQLSDTVYKGGHFVTRANKPSTIETGDSVVVTMSSINNQLGNTDDIILSNDLHTSIQFSYYDVDYPVTQPKRSMLDKSALWPVGSVTYDYAIGYSSKIYKRLDSMEFHCPDYVPRGSGPPIEVYVFPLFSWTDRNGKHQTSENNFTDPHLYSGSTVPLNSKTAKVTSVNGSPIVFLDGTLLITGMRAYLDQPSPFKGEQPTSTATFIAGSELNTTIHTPGGPDLHIGTASYVIPAGKYNRSDLATTITKGYTEVGLSIQTDVDDNQVITGNSDLNIRVDDKRFADLFFRQRLDDTTTDVTFDNTNSYVYWDPAAGAAGETPTAIVGARKFAIEYGVKGTTFQLSDAHQSFLIDPTGGGAGANDGHESVAIYQTGSNGSYRNHLIASTTGIVIHDMAPQSFWDGVVGIYQNTVVPLRVDDTTKANPVRYYILEDFVNKIPKESAQSSIYSHTNSRIVEDPLLPDHNPTVIDTTDVPTNAVIGTTTSANIFGGIYYIEIFGLGIPLSEFIFENETLTSVAAVVPVDSDSPSNVVSYEDSGYLYTNYGEPITIKDLTVRITERITGNVIDTLGDNNIVLLKINKAGPEERAQALAIAAQQKEKTQ